MTYKRARLPSDLLAICKFLRFITYFIEVNYEKNSTRYLRWHPNKTITSFIVYVLFILFIFEGIFKKYRYFRYEYWYDWLQHLASYGKDAFCDHGWSCEYITRLRNQVIRGIFTSRVRSTREGNIFSLYVGSHDGVGYLSSIQRRGRGGGVYLISSRWGGCTYFPANRVVPTFQPTEGGGGVSTW